MIILRGFVLMLLFWVLWWFWECLSWGLVVFVIVLVVFFIVLIVFFIVFMVVLGVFFMFFIVFLVVLGVLIDDLMDVFLVDRLICFGVEWVLCSCLEEKKVEDVEEVDGVMYMFIVLWLIEECIEFDIEYFLSLFVWVFWFVMEVMVFCC